MRVISTYFKDSSRLHSLSPVLLLIICDLIVWCEQKQLPCVLTDSLTTLQEDEALSRQSSTHREGRAFDVSTRGWTKENIDEVIRVFGFKFRQIAAVRNDGSPNLIYFHDAGTGPHLHFQVHRKYAL